MDSVQLAIEHSALLRHRKEGARCKLPDRHLHEMVAGPHGCFVLSFSPDGAMIAAACGQEVSIGAGDFVVYSIKIFNSDSGKLIGQLDGHHELIYDLGK